MTIHRLFILFFISTLISCASKKKVMAPVDMRPVDQRLTEETITIEKIKGHIGFLASDEMKGRQTPSPELNLAARYLSSELVKYGVKPVAADGNFLQKVPMAKEMPLNAGSLAFGGHELKINDDFLVLQGKDIKFDSETVFVNRGTEADFEGMDVTGKTVVAICGFEGEDNPQQWFYSGSQKRKMAKEKGAKSLIEIYNSAQLPFNFLVNYFTSPRVGLYDAEEDEENFHHIWMNAANEEAIRSIKEKSLPVMVDVSGASKEQFDTYNVVGMLEGSDPVLKDEYIIYSAHYDHVGIGRAVEGDSLYNGARDNAVGSVTVLSTAENLGKYPTRRSALFIFFTGEEKGLLGSEYYANNPMIPLDKVKYCFNSDNAGYNDTSRVTIMGLTRTTAQPMIEKACATFGLDAKEDANPEQNLFDRSDNVNFAKKGVPAPTFSLGIDKFDEAVNKYYHQPADSPSSLDYEYLYKFFQSYVYACRLIGNTDEPLFWVPEDKYYDAGKELYNMPE